MMCTTCSLPMTPIVIDGTEYGWMCTPCSEKQNLDRLVLAAKEALKILGSSKVQGAAEARTELYYALESYR